MMNTPGFFLLHILHALGALSILCGLVLLAFWAFRHLTPAQLWKRGWIFIGGGVIAIVLVAIATMAMHHRSGPMRGERLMKHGWDQGMMKDADAIDGTVMMRASSSMTSSVR